MQFAGIYLILVWKVGDNPLLVRAKDENLALIKVLGSVPFGL